MHFIDRLNALKTLHKMDSRAPHISAEYQTWTQRYSRHEITIQVVLRGSSLFMTKYLDSFQYSKH